MKKYFTIIMVLNVIQGFSQGFLYRHDKSTWYSLFGYAIVFIGIISYLFFKYKFEQIQRDKNPETNDEVNRNNKTEKRSSDNKSGSQELLNLFLLKRKGVISEFEYNQFKQRALKHKSGSGEKIGSASLAH